MRVDRSPMDNVRGSLTSLEKWLGMAFSIVMSGVFSRMIRDPGGERYHSILEVMGSSGFTTMTIIIAVLVLLVYYYGDRFGIWIPQTYHYYATILLCAVALYLGGYVVIDNPIVGATALFFSGGLLAVLAVKKESWGIAEVGILSRLIGSG